VPPEDCQSAGWNIPDEDGGTQFQIACSKSLSRQSVVELRVSRELVSADRA